MADADQFFVENEVPELSSPFVMVYGPEITDSRLSWAEKGLLWWLRYRCCRKTKTWVSWKTVAEDFGESESNIRKKAAKLKKLGWIRCESRGLGKSKIKVLSRPSAHYPKEVFTDTFEFLKGDRTEEQIAELRSVDNAKQDPLRSNLSGRTAQKVAPIPLKNKRSERDQVEADQSETDLTTYGSQGDQPLADPQSGVGFSDGEPYDLNTGEILDQTDIDSNEGKGFAVESKENSIGEIRATPDSEPEDRSDDRASAAAIIASAGARATERSKAKLDKKAARKAARDASGETEERQRLKSMTKKQKQTVGSKLHEFCREVFEDNFPDVRWGKWMRVEYSQARALLEAYDQDVELIKKGWRHICEHWDDVRRELKLGPGTPTIGFLLGFKDRIFSKIQEYETEQQAMEKESTSGKFEW